MPQFFFDTTVGSARTRDHEGIEYPDLTMALRDARRSLSDLVYEATLRNMEFCAVTVRDEGGKIIRRISAELREAEGSDIA